jgi:hypothetical protein
MRTLLASLALIALTSGAQAYCYPIPDSARAGYVGNDLKHTICLQQELAQATAARNLQTELDATLSRMQRDLQQQKFMQQQLQTEQLRLRSNSLLP